jgi:hypothetical protein
LINENIHNIPTEKVNKYIIYHYLDTLTNENRIVLINYLYKAIDIEILKPLDENEKIIKQYFDERIMEINGMKGIVLESNKIILLYIQNKETMEWTNSKPSEQLQFKAIIERKYGVSREKINRYVGFMQQFKKEGIVFKTKEMSTEHKNKGLKCSGSNKNDIIKRLNQVLENGPFSRENERNIYNDENSLEIKKTGFCVMLEIILRYYNDIELNKDPSIRKVWFFDIEKSIYNNLASL